jgi:hypothetical protein
MVARYSSVVSSVTLNSWRCTRSIGALGMV